MKDYIVINNAAFCDMSHAVAYARKNIEKGRKKLIEAKKKEFNKEQRKAKEKLKTRSDWMREAQKAFNRFIRLRDYKEPCISCGAYPNDLGLVMGSRIDAGHYRSVGSCPELRFEELNCAKQCTRCNREMSGNVVNYRINLIERIGIEKVEWLEGPHDPKKYTIDDLKEIKSKYTKLANEMQKRIDDGC